MATAILQPSPPPTASAPPPIPVPVATLYRMSCDLYERIAEAGLLGPKDRVILLDGFLVNQRLLGPTHSTSVGLGQVVLQAGAPIGLSVRAEQPILLRGGPQGDSTPQPDLALVIGSILTYARRHPIGTEVGLVVEVAANVDAVRLDRAGLYRYAHAGIPIACIVNIADRSIEVHSEPGGPSADPVYRRSETLRPGQFLAGEIGIASNGPVALGPIAVEAFFAPN